MNFCDQPIDPRPAHLAAGPYARGSVILRVNAFSKFFPTFHSVMTTASSFDWNDALQATESRSTCDGCLASRLISALHNRVCSLLRVLTGLLDTVPTFPGPDTTPGLCG